MKNKRGFTMVELLATIIILGILSIVGIMAITGLLNKSKETYLESQTKMVVMAGKSYFNDYRNKLPKSIGPIASVKLQTLIDLKYIDPVKDEKGNICVDNENISKIYVQKVNKEEYKYTGYLSCSGKESSKLDTEKPVITFNPNSITSNKKMVVEMRITDNIKVLSYRYVVYKDGKEYLDTGYNVYNKNPKITLKETGVFKIKGYAYDTSGNQGIKDTGSYSVTIKDPVCTNASVTSSIKKNTWTKGNIDLTIEPKSDTIESFTVKDIINNNGKVTNKTLFKKETSSKKKVTLKDSGIHTITLTGYNSAGISCDIILGEYYIDKEKPLKPSITNPTSGNWINKDFSLTLKSSDTLSGIAYYEYSYDNKEWTTYENSASNSFVTTPFSKERNETVYLRVVDKVGNISDVSNTPIKLDKTNPSCVSSGGSTAWSATGRTLLGTCTDTLSGCKGNVSKTINWDCDLVNQSPGTVYDKVGNSVLCPANQTVRVSTKPVRPTVYNPTGGNWVNYSFALALNTTTQSSLIGYWQYSYDNKNFTTYGNSAKNSFTTPNITSEMNRNIYIRVCSKANVCSDSISTPIRIDKTKPTIGYSLINDQTGAQYALGKWSKNGLYRYLYPEDNASGVAVTQYLNSSNNWVTENNTGKYWLAERNVTNTFRVRDKAGNYSNNLALKIMIDYTPPRAPRITGITTGSSIKYNNCIGVGGGTGSAGCTFRIYAGNGFYFFEEYVSQVDYGGSGINRKQFIWNHNGGGVKCLNWVNSCSPWTASSSGNRADRIWSHIRSVDNAGNTGPHVKVTHEITWPW